MSARAREAARLEGLVREQDLVGTQPEGYSPGEIHHATDFAKRPDSLARGWFSDAEVEAGLDVLAARQRDDGGWRHHVGGVDARDRDRVVRRW